MRHVSDRFTAVLDANVLYPFLVRDVLLSLAEAGLYRPVWSDAINLEWMKHLIERMPQKEQKIRETVEVMNEAFPEAAVTNYENLIPILGLPDPDDRHVLAVAIRGGANVIVTENVSDFPADVLDHYDIEARSADEFILNTIELYPADAPAALKSMRQRYVAPSQSAEELLQAMLRSGLVATVAALRPCLALL